ncbi:MAG: virulence factor [Pseudomonadota bacterium]
MAQLVTVFWRDIPAQVIVKAGRRNVAKRELSIRFTEAIDMCAMRVGARDSDAYLEQWRKADPVDVGDDLEAEATKAAAALEETYTDDRLKLLIKSEGYEAKDAA